MKIKPLEWKEIKAGCFAADCIEPLSALVSGGVAKTFWCVSHPDSEGDGQFLYGFADTIAEAKSACNAAHAKLFEGWVIE